MTSFPYIAQRLSNEPPSPITLGESADVMGLIIVIATICIGAYVLGYMYIDLAMQKLDKP